MTKRPAGAKLAPKLYAKRTAIDHAPQAPVTLPIVNPNNGATTP
jgi:hypothetical protein